jgi:hypothetical protein
MIFSLKWIADRQSLKSYGEGEAGVGLVRFRRLEDGHRTPGVSLKLRLHRAAKFELS